MEAEAELVRLFNVHNVHPDVIIAVGKYVYYAEEEAYLDGYDQGRDG